MIWVRRAVCAALADRRPAQIHVSWLSGLGQHAAGRLRAVDQAMFWPEAVQQVTGRTIASVRQNTRAGGANPFEARTFGIPDAAKVLVSHLTTYDQNHRPVELSRYAWPTDMIRLTEECSYRARAEPPP